MSANPEAFEYMRKEAYAFVNTHGKDRRPLEEFCAATMKAWRTGEGSGSNLRDVEATQIAIAVSNWVLKNYVRPRKKAERRREVRAATELASPILLEFATEIDGKSTIRNAATMGGQSKSTVARHLQLQGIAPARNAKIQQLPGHVKRLVALLDESFPRDGTWLVKRDHVARMLWDRAEKPSKPTPKSTMSTRRAKLSEYVKTVTDAGIGFNVIVYEDLIAIRRGRKFRGAKDTVTWIEEELRLNGTYLLRLPDAPLRETSFWADPWLSDILSVMSYGLQPYFYEAKQLEPLIRLTRPLLDPRPLYHLFDVITQHSVQNDFALDLWAVADRVRDPDLKKAAQSTSVLMSNICESARYGPLPIEYFDSLDREIQFMRRLKVDAPDSFAKVAYFRDVILAFLTSVFEDEADCAGKALLRCRQLKKAEAEGKWTLPIFNRDNRLRLSKNPNELD